MDKSVIAHFFITLIQTVMIEIIAILGIFFFIGFILSKLQQATHNNYRKTIGWKGILLTAWIGTPIHELGHIFFAKIFRHKIEQVNFFKPNKHTGELGHVDHSYNKRSIYQQIGNFFIGAAPMIFGSIVLIALFYFLVPNAKEILLPLTQANTPLSIESFVAVKNIVLFLFSRAHLDSPAFWIFLYISFCISAHIAPSKQDRTGMWKGFFWMILVLIICNSIPLVLGVDVLKYVSKIYASTTAVAALFLYTLIISLIHFAASWLLLAAPYRIFHKS
jgi:hypothetical protein